MARSLLLCAAGRPAHPSCQPAGTRLHRAHHARVLSVPVHLQPCVFRVDYQLEQAGNKEFGSVFINEKENAAVSLVANGWAKVRAFRQATGGCSSRAALALQHKQAFLCTKQCLSTKYRPWLLNQDAFKTGMDLPAPFCARLHMYMQVRAPGGQQSPFYDELAKAQEDAEAKSLGVHTKDKDAAAASVRDNLSADGAAPPGWLACACRLVSWGELTLAVAVAWSGSGRRTKAPRHAWLAAGLHTLAHCMLLLP